MKTNFKARYIRTVQIQKQKLSGYNPIKASFIKLNPYNTKDIETMNKVAGKWDNYYAELIYEDLKSIHNKSAKEKFDVYALTLQKKNFQRLVPDKILGLVKFLRENHAYNKIDLLSADPTYSFDPARQPIYKHIGSEIIKSLQTIFPHKTIEADAVNKAIPFYIKNGFKQVSNSKSNLMIWLG